MEGQKPQAEESKTQKTEDLVSQWVERVKKAEDNLRPYFDQEKRLWEYWWMWSEREGPYRNNYVPPDAHATVESVTPRLTKGRPHLRVLPRITQDMSLEQAQALLTRTQNVEDLDRYAWQEMGFDDGFEKFVKRGVWMDFAVEKITWKTETEEVEEEEPVTFLGIQLGVKKVKRQVPIYDSPVSEIIDNTDFIYPLGYSSIETLPWAAHRIIKWRSEIDESLYDKQALAELDKEHRTYSPTDYKADRLRIREFPEPFKANTTENRNATTYATSSEGLGNKKDDYKVELVEIYTRKSKDHPKGQTITIANGKVKLRAKDNPTPDADLPFNAWTPIDDTYHLRGMGLVREQEKVLLYKKKQRDQRLDNVDIIIQGMGLLSDSETVDDDEFTAFAGNIVRLSNIDSYKPLVRPDVTGSSVREEEVIDRDGQRATAANDYVSGAGANTKRTATEVEKVTGSSGERYDGIIRRLNRVLNRRGRIILKLYQKNWDTAKLAHLIGPDGAVEFKKMAPFEFEGDFDFQYDVRSVLATKEVTRSQGMELISMLSKIPADHPQFQGMNLRPVVMKVIETFEELKIDPKEVLPDLPPQLPEGPQPEEMNLPGPEQGTPDLASILSQSSRI
jgi:hypothetical protein